jgi:hypothetical protein
MKFYELAIGARFTFHCQQFEKLAMSMARNGELQGHVFMGITEVEPNGIPALLSPEEAAIWKPDERDWTDYLSPAPGPVSAPGGRQFTESERWGNRRWDAL